MSIMEKSPELREVALKLEIESAKPEDADAIARIQHDSWLATYPNAEAGISVETIEKRLGDLGKRSEFWQKTIEGLPENVHVDVVRKDGSVIGFCKVAKGEAENHIDALYLDPTCKKQGAGGAVFRSGLQWLGADKSISLEVVAYNADSIAFYEHFGFQQIGAGKGVDLRNGQIMPDLVMRRPVSSKSH